MSGRCALEPGLAESEGRGSEVVGPEGDPGGLAQRRHTESGRVWVDVGDILYSIECTLLCT